MSGSESDSEPPPQTSPPRHRIDGYRQTGVVLGHGPNGVVEEYEITSEAASAHPNWPDSLALKVFHSLDPAPPRIRHRNVATVLRPSPKGELGSGQGSSNCTSNKTC